MAAMDEFKAERDAVKNGPFKQRLEYFWDYHKWHVMIPLFIAIIIGVSIYQAVTKPETVVSGIVLNTYSQTAYERANELSNDYVELKGLDPSEYIVDMNTNLAYSVDTENGVNMNYDSLQAINAQTGAGVIDFMVADLATMLDFEYRSMFHDLRDVLTEDQVEKLEPYFLYIDRDILVQRQAYYEEHFEASDLAFTDCHKPEEMKEPVPVLLDISKCEKIASIYEEPPKELALAIPNKTERIEALQPFLEYLFEE